MTMKGVSYFIVLRERSIIYTVLEYENESLMTLNLS